MTTVLDNPPAPPVPKAPGAPDHRGSWIPNGAMIRTRLLELRRRRGLMIALAVVDIGLPTLFLVIRLISHAVAPKSYGPAGGYDIYTNLVAGVMYIFGFIVAATVGCTAGSSDLTDGMFRHLVVTGRSRLALYLARIPAGLAIVWSMLAVGFTIVCLVCVFAAPTQVNYDGANVPVGLSVSGFEKWAAAHPQSAYCDLPAPQPFNAPCGPNGTLVSPGQIHHGKGGGVVINGGPQNIITPTHSQLVSAAITMARQSYGGYTRLFLYPSNSLMIRSGLWLGLETTIGFLVGLGLGSLLGQRTVAVILMIVYEIILTPILSTHVIPHLINAERGLVGLATAHLEPGQMPLPFGGGGGPNGGPNANPLSQLVPETRLVSVLVIVGWLVVWTALGAWRMRTRDA
ncbi:MAG: hypothetical protein ACRDY1_05925 [Acidimicrobiales bacterium]